VLFCDAMPVIREKAPLGDRESPPELSEMTWTEVRELDRRRLVALLPLGAVEAHGPHLPLATDGIIAGAMADEAARRLAATGWAALRLPAIDYSPAPFAAGFPGTVSLRPETTTALIEDIGASVAGWGVPVLAIANAHLDPAHLGAVRRAVATLRRRGSLRVAFPMLSRKPWASRLGEEFRSGACHAGRFESSVVLVARPDLVRREVSASLEPNPASLSTAIRAGRTTFAEAGGPRAYFGDPAAATADEGAATLTELGAILAEAVLAEIEAAGDDGAGGAPGSST
jgi:creatinine amidohydrolase